MRFLHLACILFSGCAQTEFRANGQRVALFQGDMRNMHFQCRVDSTGTMFAWDGDIDHSTATVAQKKGVATIIGNIGTAVAASGIMSSIK